MRPILFRPNTAPTAYFQGIIGPEIGKNAATLKAVGISGRLSTAARDVAGGNFRFAEIQLRCVLDHTYPSSGRRRFVPCLQLSADYSRFLSAGNSRVKVVPIPAQRRLALMSDAASIDGFCARGLILKRLFKGFQLSQSL
jgi:hypothetical protein